MQDAGLAPLPATIRTGWEAAVDPILSAACVMRPDGTFTHSGGQAGIRHTEHLGHMLDVVPDPEIPVI